jgi:hypothetical protein
VSIRVTCPACGKQSKAPDSAAGKKGRCPDCGAAVEIPAADILDAEIVEATEVTPSAPPPPPKPSVAPPPLPADGRPAGMSRAAREFFDKQEDSGPIGLSTPVTPPPQGEGGDRRPCPVCGEMIPASALKCRYCNEIFDPALKRQEARKAKSSFSGGEGDNLTVGEWVVAILCSGIGCIVGIVWMIQGKPKGKKMFLISLCVQIFWVIVRVGIEAANGGFR